jgi:DNA-binding NarL/FixJ family response regulator
VSARVLIVDDNPAVRRALRHLLEGGGPWQIIEAEDGQTAIARALEARPHVIVLDLVMPVMDGLNAAREISQALPETAIVMYSMHSSPSLEVEAKKSGVRTVVSKLQSGVLLSTVRELIAALPPENTPNTASEAIPPLILSANGASSANSEKAASDTNTEIPKQTGGKLAS